MRISDWSSDVCSSDLFDKSTGQIIRYSYRGKDLMSAGPELAFGEPGDTSKNDTLEKNRILWDQAVRESTLLEYQITEDVNGNYYLSFTKILLGGDARLFQRFRIDGRGAMLVQNRSEECRVGTGGVST